MSKQPDKTLWHRLLAALLTYILTPVNIIVQTDVPIMTDPPEVDILLLRREGKEWTHEQRQRLPDGIRDGKAHTVLIEFKATESVNLSKLRQITAYGHFYEQSQRMRAREVDLVLLAAVRPQSKTLHKFDFALAKWPGVYKSNNPMLAGLTLLVLSELNDEPHNAFVKCFARQKKAKKEAFQTLGESGFRLVEQRAINLLFGLQQLWFKGEEPMTNEWTPEKVMKLGEQWIDVILDTLPPERVLEHYRPEDLLQLLEPEERLRGLRPEERLQGLRPEERLHGLRREEIEAYLHQLKQQEKLGNGNKQVES
jgi:hypothetical protein